MYYNSRREVLLQFIPEDSDCHLDVGCGEGGFLSALKELGIRELWGIEPHKKSADIAVSLGDINILNTTIEEALSKLPDVYFTSISFNDVLEHTIDPLTILKEAKSKLKPDGRIIVSLPNVRHITNLYNLLIRKDWRYTESGILDKTHLRFYTKKSMCKLVSDAGYNLTNIVGINRYESVVFRILNFITLGFFDDTKFLQYALTLEIE